MKKLPKLILTDIDGVWTDGSMIYHSDGSESKKFNTSDSAGVLFCRLLQIPVGIITGEQTPIVAARANKLKVDYCFMGIHNKVKIADDLRRQLTIDWEDIAYIGDDLNDMALLKKVGFAACVPDAPDYVKLYVDYVTTKKGGAGAFRDFVEFILNKHELLDQAIEKALNSLLD